MNSIDLLRLGFNRNLVHYTLKSDINFASALNALTENLSTSIHATSITTGISNVAHIWSSQFRRIKIGSWLPTNSSIKGDDFGYVITVVPRNEYESYKIEKPYSQLKSFYKDIYTFLVASFPAEGMRNVFPTEKLGGKVFFSSKVTDSMIDDRMVKLSLWLEEVCSSALFMSNPNAFNKLSNFLEFDAHVKCNHEPPLPIS